MRMAVDPSHPWHTADSETLAVSLDGELLMFPVAASEEEGCAYFAVSVWEDEGGGKMTWKPGEPGSMRVENGTGSVRIFPLDSEEHVRLLALRRARIERSRVR